MKKAGIIRCAALLIAAVFVFSAFAGCVPYSSHYRAVAFVHTNTAKNAQMSFMEFEGQMVFKLKAGKDSTIKYEAELETGSASVWIDAVGTKQLMFSPVSGDVFDNALELELDSARTVYIIVETDGKCLNGRFGFTVTE